MLLLGELLPGSAHAQAIDSVANGPIDSLAGGTVRPRRDTYIIEAFPSPAVSGQSVTIQYYNHVPMETELRVVDLLDRMVTSIELQPRALTPNGLHSFRLSTSGLSAGLYFIRLTTFALDGSVELVQDSRFVVAH